MNGIRLKEIISVMDEEQLRDFFVPSIWTVEDVDERIEILSDDYDTSHITREDKRLILDRALDEAGNERQEDITEAIDGFIMQECEEVAK